MATVSKPQNIAIFANPIAGRGKGKKISRRLADEFNSEGINATVISAPASIAASSLLADVDAAIVIGGDGTLRSVARRFYADRGAVPPLLPVPMGTANLMGRYLDIKWKSSEVIDRVVASIHRAEVRNLDAAIANDELFLLMAGVGMDGFIIHELDRIRRGPINYASYILPAALAWTIYEYSALTVRVDGKKVFNAAPAMAFIGNISEYGTGFPLLPDARPDDGLLDICVIPAHSRMHVVEQFLHAAAGEHLLTEGVLNMRGTRFEIESSEPVPVQIDGEPAGHTPVRIDLLPVRVPFIVPA